MSPRVNPIHSVLSPVHHNNSLCTERNNIESKYRREGTGNKPLCQHCAKLNREGR